MRSGLEDEVGEVVKSLAIKIGRDGTQIRMPLPGVSGRHKLDLRPLYRVRAGTTGVVTARASSPGQAASDAPLSKSSWRSRSSATNGQSVLDRPVPDRRRLHCAAPLAGFPSFLSSWAAHRRKRSQRPKRPAARALAFLASSSRFLGGPAVWRAVSSRADTLATSSTASWKEVSLALDGL